MTDQVAHEDWNRCIASRLLLLARIDGKDRK